MAEFKIKSVQQPILNVVHARTFLKELLTILGFGFHPDTPAEEYINTDTREATFSEIEAVYVNARLEALLRVYGDEEILYDEIDRMLKETHPEMYQIVHG